MHAFPNIAFNFTFVEKSGESDTKSRWYIGKRSFTNKIKLRKAASLNGSQFIGGS